MVTVVDTVTVVGGDVTVCDSVTVVVGCLTVTLADCEVVDGLAVWEVVEVTVVAPTPATAETTMATATPATNDSKAASHVQDRRWRRLCPHDGQKVAFAGMAAPQ